MVKTTFGKILKGPQLDVTRTAVEKALRAQGYSIRECPMGLEAVKWHGGSRYHFIFELYTDGTIHNGSQIIFHEDIDSRNRKHPVVFTSSEIGKEFNHFVRELIEQIRKEKTLS